MSSDEELQSFVAQLLVNNYVSVAIVTAISYDYIITLSNEINYVWNRPWTFVSYMFLFVRYAGMTVAFIQGLCRVLYFTGLWTYIAFLAAAEIVMILRLYAMYGQSKTILGVLLVFYTATIGTYVASTIYYTRNSGTVTIIAAEVLDMSFCDSEPSTTDKLYMFKNVPRITLAALMFILALIRLCLESYQSYKETKQWKVNRYIRLLVREGILYFFAHLMYTMNFGTTVGGTIMGMLAFVTTYILSPRFIVSVRELHLRSLLQVSSGWDAGIDTGFGLTMGKPTLMFADPESTNDVPERELEMRGMTSDAH